MVGGPEVGGLMVLFGTHCCLFDAAVNTSAADGVDASSCMHLRMNASKSPLGSLIATMSLCRCDVFQ